MDRPYYLRLVSTEDRLKPVDFANNASNDRMKWGIQLPAGKEITWEPVPVKRTSHKTDSVTSFDIGVVVNGRVVLFRNQSIQFGASRSDVLANQQQYIENDLHLRAQPPEQFINVQQQVDRQFTGTLDYALLADQVTDAKKGGDLDIMDAADFAKVRQDEDKLP